MAMLPNPLPKLADDPSGQSLGLSLPPGTLVDATMDGPWHEPLFWYADAAARPGDWTSVLPARRAAGLHPVLLGSVAVQAPADWELMPGETGYPGDHDAEDVLAGYWEYTAEEEPAEEPGASAAAAGETSGPQSSLDEVIAPFDSAWPGLAAATLKPGDDTGTAVDAAAEAVADSLAESGSWLQEARLALVPARRSADIPAAIGWSGPVNYEGDVAVLCSVLRSWEDRFGARVVALTFDQLVLSVAAPPATEAEAEAVAAEHFAFCPDNITQGHHDTLRGYARHELLGRNVWHFWWD